MSTDSRGETKLRTLLRTLDPHAKTERLVFTRDFDPRMHPNITPLMVFQETEGTTAILTTDDAARLGIDPSPEFTCITLQVHSSLQAVGLTAAVSTVLAKNKIPANVVSAYYHDHIFVPCQDATRALRLLKKLSRTAEKTNDRS